MYFQTNKSLLVIVCTAEKCSIIDVICSLYLSLSSPYLPQILVLLSCHIFKYSAVEYSLLVVKYV